MSFTDDAGNSEGPLTSNEYPEDASDGELRLEDGPTAAEGRLEVFHNGKWGTVCDDRFDNKNNIAPQKACQFMGYTTGELIPSGTMRLAPQSQKIWLDDLRCFAGSTHWTGAAPTKLHHCYHAGWGNNNCTRDENVHLSCTGQLNQTEATALTATLEDFPTNHDGSSAFTFRIALSAEVTISPQDMKDHALTVTGGTVTNATQVDDRSDLWELTLEPDGTGAVFILVPLGRACTETGALCTANGQMLTTAPGHSVPGPAPMAQGQQAPAPLAASFVSVPGEHDGATEFWLELSFDAPVVKGSKRHIRALLGVTGGAVTRVRRKDDRLDHWRIRIEPSSHEAVTVTLSPSPACGATGAVCTNDRRTFTTALATQIQGPPGLTVADAEVEEAVNATLAFAVTLNRAPSGTVTVDYATSDNTATSGSDYTATSGTLSFAAGETAKTISVPVLDDAHNEGSETLTLTLSNPSGAYIKDGEATGTITNTDHMPKAWLARFGRTVAEQVLDGVRARMTAPRETGLHGSLAGVGFDDMAPLTHETADLFAQSDEKLGGMQDKVQPLSSRTPSGRDLLSGTAFALIGETAGGGTAGFWGRGAVTDFDGREGDLSLDGEVTTGLLGADYGHGRWLVGMIASHSRGEGDYRGASEGRISSTVTGLYPWVRYAVSEHLAVWGAAGYGEGALTLKPGTGDSMRTDLSLAMAATGVRSELVARAQSGGLELALESDAMVVRTDSDSVSGASGRLASAQADVSQVRLALDSSWRIMLAGGAALTPSLEVGVRHDGGDAERGFGADIGGGLTFADLSRGLSFDVSARTLVTHEESGFQERGLIEYHLCGQEPQVSRSGTGLLTHQPHHGAEEVTGQRGVFPKSQACHGPGD